LYSGLIDLLQGAKRLYVDAATECVGVDIDSDIEVISSSWEKVETFGKHMESWSK